jgi:hypothetical protein
MNTHFRHVNLYTLPACSLPPASYSLLTTTHLLCLSMQASRSLVHDILRHILLYSGQQVLISYGCLSMQASRLPMIFRVNVCHGFDTLITSTTNSHDYSLVMFIYGNFSRVHDPLGHISLYSLLFLSYVYLCKLPACS